MTDLVVKQSTERVAGADIDQVARLFAPRSIALIGATDKSWWSRAIYANLQEHGFTGDIHLVNPKGIEVHGQRSFAAIADLPADVDLAFVMTPTPVTLEVVEKVADHGIRSAVVLTSGFAEVGEEGALLERALVDLARERELLILGPNGNGFINAAAGITPYGLSIPPPLIGGPVGIVLQSGALASAVLGFAQARNVGISLMVSMGNESMLTMTDVMRHMVHDDDTKVIALFIESVRDPEQFLAVAREALALGKPVVAMKVGRSVTGARVAKAHTGSLVGDDQVMEAVFQQHGIVRVDSLEDLVTTAAVLAHCPLPGRRFGFVTASGGACEIIADRGEDEGIEIPPFAPQTEDRLREIVPPFASPHNPVDVTGYILVNREMMGQSLHAVLEDPNIDAAVVMADLPREEPADPTVALESATRLAQLARAARKPVFVMQNTLTDITPYGRSVAERTGYPTVLGGIEHGLTALGRAVQWSAMYRGVPDSGREQSAAPLELDPQPTGTWSEHVAAGFLRQHGVPVVPSELALDADEAVSAAERFGYPVVVKLAADIEHKSDIGGVRLGVGSADEVREAYDAVTTAGRGVGARVAGAVVQPQRFGGVELLVGIVTDPVWGHVLALGMGGLWVEVLGDTALRVLPVGRDEIRAALLELRGAPLLTGARGSTPADLDRLVDAVDAIVTLAQRLGDRLESLEVNPLVVDGSRIEALDALITWRQA